MSTTPDPLGPLLERYPISAAVFHAGALCGLTSYERDDRVGHFHLVRRGEIKVLGLPGGPVAMIGPSLLYLPRPGRHRIHVRPSEEAEVVCAEVLLGHGGSNSLRDNLPDQLLLDLRAPGPAAACLDALYEEGFGQHAGRQFALNRLCELVMLMALRHALSMGWLRGGLLGALSDPALARAMVAFQHDPARSWTLSDLAQQAGMSRARFAARFKEVAGTTPLACLAQWRLAMAAELLRTGRPLKAVADEVGYGSASALTRAFSRVHGAPAVTSMKTARAQRA